MTANPTKQPTLFYADEAADAFNAAKQRGFSVRFRVDVKSKSGGTFIAQVSRRGEYVRAQHVDPVKAVQLLAKRIVEANKNNGWRKWRGQPWAREVHL